MIADPQIARAFETTWPAAEYASVGGLVVGRGRGGGGRVSSARAARPDWSDTDIARAEAVQRGWNEQPMFRVADDDAALAAALVAQGYRHGTPTAILAADCAHLGALPVPPMTAFPIWPPLAMQRDIWRDGSVSAPRQAVMDRVALPKTALLGRITDRAAGAAFVALDGPVAMIHAIEVVPALRRQGVAGWLVRMAAIWAQEQGADRLALAVSRANTAARAAYDRLGFTELGGYGYWSKD
ncbi:GNAT family N-acetyltransferase [Paracoccus methylovorus]|uniref:GNAT family N-acetyltransferase n=1 Tax=Paracoccus methylovorus TaxID=2812658 RepID=A0ABX7JGA8_9RHOB|nr:MULTISPECIES: GNAT family N-acetyltransferase [Paracoccus]QRZ12288.1 GNAT family N-acetyltransferase [Paracoccus methylovorus]